MATEQRVSFQSLDGLHLVGTLTSFEHPATAAAVLVHGGGATRDEAGYFTRLAGGLAEAGISSMRFDLRGHGESGGRQEDLTIAAIVNDIRAAFAFVHKEIGNTRSHLYGTSFSGGACALYAASHPTRLSSLTLANPLLNYKKRFIDDKPYWHDDRISNDAAQLLSERGSLEHSPTFRLGRPLINEVFHVRPLSVLADLTVPTLFVHGTDDTFIPIESSRTTITLMTKAQVNLAEIKGAQHGFAVHDDPTYREPQTQAWQANVIRTVADWMTAHS